MKASTMPSHEQRVLSLWQPWATLIALGIKTIETRSWSTTYRGSLAIHASKKAIPGALGAFTVEDDTPRGCSKQYLMWGESLSWPYRLPLGAIVATCELVDVVPIGGASDFPITEDGYEDYVAAPVVIVHHQPFLSFPEELVLDDRGQATTISEQLPYGDYAPGRYAWMLEEIEPVNPPVPALGRQGLFKFDAT